MKLKEARVKQTKVHGRGKDEWWLTAHEIVCGTDLCVPKPANTYEGRRRGGGRTAGVMK